jgi:hypothetical protein
MFFMMSIESYKNIINLTDIRSKNYNLYNIYYHEKFSDIVLFYKELYTKIIISLTE